MSVHCTCCILVIYVFPFQCCCASVDRGVEELLQFFDIFYLCQFNKASVNPLLCASLLTYVFPKYFIHDNIAYDSNVF